MKAVCWHGARDIRVDTVPEPSILNPRDAIIKVTSTAICGSDLHLYNGVIPTMKAGDVLGHEFMGEVVEVGRANQALHRGDRVVVPFCIACGGGSSCRGGVTPPCGHSQPHAEKGGGLHGFSRAAPLGRSPFHGG